MEETFGDIWGWRGFIAYFPMCEGFEFSGFYITKTRTWAISVEHSSGGYFGNIEFNTSCVNGDGLNLRVGCSHMVIENIFGKTADDFIALNTGASKCRDSYPITTWKSYLYPLIASECVDFDENERDDHTHDVKIRNVHVRTDHFSQGVAFLSRGGNKIFNIDIQGVYDENPIGSRIKSNLIGVYYMGFGQPNSAAMIENINIDTAVSNSYASAVLFREHVLDLTVKNVVQNAPEGVAVMARDEDIIEIVNCQTVSGVIRDSAINWKPITT
jgi:polygalacturonase